MPGKDSDGLSETFEVITVRSDFAGALDCPKKVSVSLLFELSAFELLSCGSCRDVVDSLPSSPA